MKKLFTVLLVSLIVVSSVFATVTSGSAYSIGAPAPKSSVTLNGIASANFQFDIDSGEGQFMKEGRLAHVDLSAVKSVTKGNGGLIGTGDIYAAVAVTFDLSVSLDYDNPAQPDSQSPYINNIYNGDKSWSSTIKNFANVLSLTSLFKFTDFYVAKDGYWKLDLMKSDAALDYAVSAVDTYKLLLDSRRYYHDGIKSFGVSNAVKVDENTGVTLTFEQSPIYLQEVSMGFVVDKYNFLVETMPIVFNGGYAKIGAVYGTYVDGANTYKNGGVSLQARYAQKAFRFVAATDLILSDMEGEKKFDADASLKLETFGFTVDAYYATKAETRTRGGYSTYADGYVASAWKNLISVAVSYAGAIDEFEFSAKLSAKNLKFKKIFGASIEATNGKLGIEAYADFAVYNKAYDFGGEISYAFEQFGVSAAADYDSTSKNVGIAVVASTDTIVNGALVSLAYETANIKTTKGAVTASISVEF